jgi:hypothetical protein
VLNSVNHALPRSVLAASVAIVGAGAVSVEA